VATIIDNAKDYFCFN